MEHFALHKELSLEAFCNSIKELFTLPAFVYDCENETEWAESIGEIGTLNVSRPYEQGTLSEWDNSVPHNCNFGISLFNKDLEQKNILEFGQLIADKLECSVYYHRTWIKPGENIIRNIEFNPKDD